LRENKLKNVKTMRTQLQLSLLDLRKNISPVPPLTLAQFTPTTSTSLAPHRASSARKHFRRRHLLGLLGFLFLAGPLLHDAVATAPSFPDGFITARVYMNCGPSIYLSALLSDPSFPDSPDMVVFEPYFELWATGDGSFPAPVGNSSPPYYTSTTTTYTNYGAQMLGYFYPPKTGNYTFYICSDDNSELFLSTDDNPANKLLIAAETVWSNPREYTSSDGGSSLSAKRSDQYTGTEWPTGNTITLTQGTPYYIEAIMKQGSGGDNLSVSIDGVTPIGQQLLSSFQGAAELQPQNVANVNSNSPWSVTVVGGVTNIVAGGLDVWDTSGASGGCVPLDGFVFDYIPVTADVGYISVRGDFDYRLRVISMTDPSSSGYSKCGLMARENLTPGSPHVYCAATPPPPGQGFFQALGRDLPSPSACSWGYNGPTAPYPNAWLRLRRVGPVYNFYWGTNGYTWQQFSVHDTSVNGPTYGISPLLLGIATTAHNVDAPVAGATVTAQVSDFGPFFTIAQQPLPQQVVVGSKAVFSVTVTNVQPADVQYQWLFNGAPITTGVTGNQLVIATANTNNEGLYSCRITYVPCGDTITTCVAPLRVLPPSGAGGVTAFVFENNGPGASVAYLLADPLFPNVPDIIQNEPYFELWATGNTNTPPPTNSEHFTYGARLVGTFSPSKTGNYTFYICSDDTSELFLSTDANPTNKLLIAAETAWSSPRQYTTSAGSSNLTAKRSDQYTGTQWPTGNTITLKQGTNYYIEAIMKQGGGSDNLSVSIDGTGPIPGQLLAPFPPIQQQPSNGQVPFGGTALFSVTVSNAPSGGVQFQWLFNGAIIKGATNSQLVVTNCSATNDGSYSVKLTSPTYGPLENSGAATLDVVPFAFHVYLLKGSSAINLQFPTSWGANYQLEQSTDLKNWTDIGSPIPGTGQYVYVTQSTSNSSYYFYRVRSL